jgi:hypothetical protein
MGRIKYQEAAGLEVKRGRPLAGHGRFIRAGYPAPGQLILDKGKDLNEFFMSFPTL